ncbi:hypothetical protein C8R48DRAFT_809983 [Suillus tomentosus]|nr:hypothetical protein C8R48DRAFT_809983 [Suillus tomentosus]
MPDIGSLSLNPRLHDNYDGDNRQQYQFSANQQLSGQFNPLGGMTPSPLKMKPTRAGLPTQWLDNSMAIPNNRPLSPYNNSDFSSFGSSPPLGHLQASALAPSTPNQNAEDQVIPTAIIVKNIPFNASLSIHTPYTFNYHLDQQGSFPADADTVVAALNGFDIQGRKLRVEYKKVLQVGEKERIERERAIRRMHSMQLEKEQQQAVQQAYDDFGPKSSSPNELDLNNPSTLEIYSCILLFKGDRMRDELAFLRTLSQKQRRVVHLIAQELGDERYAIVTHIDPNRTQRAQAVILSRAPSAYLSATSSQSQIASSLRMKKSVPDMKPLHTQAPRLATRASNGNIREGYATIASQ